MLVLLTVYFRISWPTFDEFIRAMDFCSLAFCDFVLFYSEMGKEIFFTKTPVLGYHYSSFFAIILGVFAFLPLSTSTIVWAALVFLSSVALFVLSSKAAFPDAPFRFLVLSFAVFATSFPILHNFKWGQVSVALVLCLVGVLLAQSRGRWILAAFLLAAATSLKYYPAVFILPFLFKKDWRMVVAYGGWCAVLFLGVPALVLGYDAAASFLSQIPGEVLDKQRSAMGHNSQFFPNVIERWISGTGMQGGISRTGLRTAGLLTAEGSLALSFILLRIKIERAMEWSFVLLFLSLPFIVATSWPHYFVFLPFCQFFLFSQLQERGFSQAKLLSACVALSAVGSSVMMLQAWGGWEQYNEAGVLFTANVLLLAASYGILLPRIKKAWN